MRKTRLRTAHLCLLAGVLPAVLAGCGDDDDDGTVFPYRPNETVVIGPAGDVTERTPDGDACIDLPSGDCARPQRDCGNGARADVLLDGEGGLIDTICLPGEVEIGLVYVEDGKAVVPDNGAVVILGRQDLLGDLVVEGNESVIYGESPAETVLDGDLELRGNESIVRGVTVTGDVAFDGNSAQLYHCVVFGDVVLKGNENFISNCTIFGSIHGSGNEDRVIHNYVQRTIEFSGAPAECRDNLLFEDADGIRSSMTQKRPT